MGSLRRIWRVTGLATSTPDLPFLSFGKGLVETLIALCNEQRRGNPCRQPHSLTRQSPRPRSRQPQPETGGRQELANVRAPNRLPALQRRRRRTPARGPEPPRRAHPAGGRCPALDPLGAQAGRLRAYVGHVQHGRPRIGAGRPPLARLPGARNGRPAGALRQGRQEPDGGFGRCRLGGATAAASGSGRPGGAGRGSPRVSRPARSAYAPGHSPDRKAQLPAGLPETVSCHWLPHAAASHALEGGAPVHVVQQTLGHASLATTSRYTHAPRTASQPTCPCDYGQNARLASNAARKRPSRTVTPQLRA